VRCLERLQVSPTMVEAELEELRPAVA
jgi:hypothetical protein